MSDTSVKFGGIEAICITHLHGDHVNGLPSLLCTLGYSKQRSSAELTIVGPQGLAALVVSSLAASAVAAPMSVTILELSGTAHSRTPSLGAHVDSQKEAVLMRGGSGKGGPVVVRRMVPEHAPGIWTDLPSLAGFTVRAVELHHNVPCVGYTFEETLDAPVQVDGAAARLRVEEQAELLRNAGFEPPIRALRELQRGRAVLAADGSTVLLDPSDESLCRAVTPCRVAILGDHSQVRPRARAYLRDLDLLLHECTITGFGSASNDRAVAEERFHSSPEMAGLLSASVNPGLSALTHISGRVEPHHEQELVDRAAAAASASAPQQGGRVPMHNLAGLRAADGFVVAADNTTFKLGKRVGASRAPITIHNSRKAHWMRADA